MAAALLRKLDHNGAGSMAAFFTLTKGANQLRPVPATHE
jgi:hypothetical protein